MKKPYIFILFFLIFTSLYFLTFNHSAQTAIYTSASYDEFRNLNVVQGILNLGFPNLLGQNYWQHPPLFFYSDAIISKLFNLSPQAASSILMPIVGGLTIAFTFLLAAEILSEPYALVAAFLTGGLPYVWLGFNVYLNDAFVLFFGVLSFYLLSRVLNKKDSYSWVLLAISLGFGVLSKITFFPIVFAILLGYVDRIELKQWAKILIAFLAVTVPYYVYKVLNGFEGIFGVIGDNSNLGTILGIGQGNTPQPLSYFITNLNLFYPVVLLVPLALGVWYFIKENKSVKTELMRGFITAIICLIFISCLAAFKDYRYWTSIIPLIVIISLYGCEKFLEKMPIPDFFLQPEPWFFIVSTIMLIGLFGSTFILAASQGTYDNQSNLVNALVSLNNPGNVVLTDGNYMQLAYNAGQDGIYIDDLSNYSDIIKFNARYVILTNPSNESISRYLIPINQSIGLYRVKEFYFQNATVFEVVNSTGGPIEGALVGNSRTNANGVALVTNPVYPIRVENLCFNPVYINDSSPITLYPNDCIINGELHYRY